MLAKTYIKYLFHKNQAMESHDQSKEYYNWVTHPRMEWDTKVSRTANCMVSINTVCHVMIAGGDIIIKKHFYPQSKRM